MKDSENLVDRTAAAGLLAALAEEFAVVRNPESVFPPYELYPLLPKRTALERGMAAAVMDMDGTTTTTEALCLHSLETMVRRVIGAEGNPDWPGLDRERDYPHIIGNSTTKHVEYLVRTYGERLDRESFTTHCLFASVWNFAKRPERGAETLASVRALGVEEDLFDRLVAEAKSESFDWEGFRANLPGLLASRGARSRLQNDTDIVRAAIEIYYQEYHRILLGIAEGKSQQISENLFGESDRRLIEPMKGVGYFLASIRGLLGPEVGRLYEEMAQHLVSLGFGEKEIEARRHYLELLGAHFAANPVRIGLVTSSIEYEANIVLSEVFRRLEKEAESWEVDTQTRDRVAESFSDYRKTYKAVVTASDSCEIRLKPHRDLYSLALGRLGISPCDFDRVIGFEDSQSGILAIRAAGIGLGVALPFLETQGHCFEAASDVARGGLPEVILLKRCYLPDALLG